MAYWFLMSKFGATKGQTVSFFSPYFVLNIWDIPTLYGRGWTPLNVNNLAQALQEKHKTSEWESRSLYHIVMRRKSSDKTQERQTTVHYIKQWMFPLNGTSVINCNIGIGTIVVFISGPTVYIFLSNYMFCNNDTKNTIRDACSTVIIKTFYS